MTTKEDRIASDPEPTALKKCEYANPYRCYKGASWCNHPKTLIKYSSVCDPKECMYQDGIQKGIEIGRGNRMPLELTAENGAKALLVGEFFETYEIVNPEYCGCGDCDYCNMYPDEPETIAEKITVSWATIKDIYKKIVDFYVNERRE